MADFNIFKKQSVYKLAESDICKIRIYGGGVDVKGILTNRVAIRMSANWEAMIQSSGIFSDIPRRNNTKGSLRIIFQVNKVIYTGDLA